MRAHRLIVLGFLLATAASCAPKPVVVPSVATPRHPEYVEPRVPAGVGTAALVQRHGGVWQFLQAGDLRTAQREAAAILALQPSFYPTLTSAAYIALAGNDEAAALTQFDRALAARADYAPALAGRGMTLEAAHRDADALEAFRAAVAADPGLVEIARRVDVLTLRALQDELTAARQAASSGQLDTAVRAYRNAIAASPDSAFLYREVAALERQRGDTRAALEHLQQAKRLDPTDAATSATIGELLEQQGDAEGALRAYAESLALDFSPAVEAKRTSLRARLDLAALPEQYRAIAASGQVSRGDLASLVGVRFASVLQSARAQDVGVITDIRGHWAERWIVATARAGVLEPFANHTFQPQTIVRRVDLAQAVARILNLVAAASPGQSRDWQGARGRFSDITAGHLAYPAASVAVASGVMPSPPDGAFRPTRIVSGAEAIAALERLQTLAGPSPTQATGRR